MQILTRIESDPDDRNVLREKHLQHVRTPFRRFLRLERPVRAAPIPLIQLGVRQDDHRIDAHAVRMQRRDAPRRLAFGLPRASRQSDHRLQNQRHSRLFDQCGCPPCVLCRVSAPRRQQNRFVHRLRAQFHRRHMMAPQPLENLRCYRIRPGRNAHIRQPSRADQFIRHRQQFLLLCLGNRGKTPTVKRRLRPAPRRQTGESLLQQFPRAHRRHRLGLPCNRVLIAEHTAAGTARVRNKHRQNGCHQSFPISSSAERAAICSASFLLLPMPSAKILLLSRTCTVNRLS